MKRFSGRLKHLLLGSLGIIAVFATAFGIMISQLADAPGPLALKHNVIIPEGTGIIEIGEMLEAEEVVASRYLFPFFYVLLEYQRPLKAGEYAFAEGASYRQVMKTLGSGITVVRKLTIPEGLTAMQIYAILEDNSALRGDLPPLAKEGTLMPETYYYSYGDRRAWIIERMAKSQTEFLAEVWPGRDTDLPFTTQQEMLALASIVEKETGVGLERGRVASVYINRLRKGMKLQADPTVIYGITEGKRDMGRPLTRADLLVDTPYNTYTREGLPPGPITNPGKDAIRAVLKPQQTRDLFFVADGKGGHLFSTNYESHTKNVGRYRAFQKGGEPVEKVESKPEAPAPVPAETAPTEKAATEKETPDADADTAEVNAATDAKKPAPAATKTKKKKSAKTKKPAAPKPATSPAHPS